MGSGNLIFELKNTGTQSVSIKDWYLYSGGKVYLNKLSGIEVLTPQQIISFDTKVEEKQNVLLLKDNKLANVNDPIVIPEINISSLLITHKTSYDELKNNNYSLEFDGVFDWFLQYTPTLGNANKLNNPIPNAGDAVIVNEIA